MELLTQAKVSKIPSLYKVLFSFRWNDEGKQAVETKAECFIPFKYALLTKREVDNMTGYMAKFLFLHFVRLSKSPLFFFPLFFSWLVMPRDLVVRLFAARTHALKLASLLRTYERWICSKSSILFNETKSRPMNIYIGQHDQTIVVLIH